MTSQKKASFNKSWLLDEAYNSWLKPAKDVNFAYCDVCRKSFSLSNMGKTALNSHMAGKKHISAVNLTKKSTDIRESLQLFVAPVSTPSKSFWLVCFYLIIHLNYHFSKFSNKQSTTGNIVWRPSSNVNTTFYMQR